MFDGGEKRRTIAVPSILWWFLVSGPCFFLLFHTQSYSFLKVWSLLLLFFRLWSVSQFSCNSDDLIIIAHFPRSLWVSPCMMPCWRKAQRDNKNSAFPQVWSWCISSIHENLIHVRSQNTEENNSTAPSTFLCKCVQIPASFLSSMCCLLIHVVLVMWIWVVAEFHFEIWGLFIGTGSTRAHLDWQLHPKVI